MVRNGPTKGGGIWAQLAVSVGVLLLTPLVLAAGVMVFGSSPRQDAQPRGAAQQSAVWESTVTKLVSLVERPDGATRFSLASVEPHPVIAEQHAVAEQRSSGQPSAMKDTSRYNTPVPIPAVAREAGAQSYPSRPITMIVPTVGESWSHAVTSGMTGVTPRPVRGAEMPGSTSAGGQITPKDSDNSSLKLALPVVSPCAGTAKPLVLASQPGLGVDEIGGGAVWSDCADAFVRAAITATPTMIQGRISTS
jgi:hypothetical protein